MKLRLIRTIPTYTRTILGPMAVVGVEGNTVFLYAKTVYIMGEPWDAPFTMDVRSRMIRESDTETIKNIKDNSPALKGKFEMILDFGSTEGRARLVELILALALDDRIDGRQMTQVLNKCGYVVPVDLKITRLHNGGISFENKNTKTSYSLFTCMVSLMKANKLG